MDWMDVWGHLPAFLSGGVISGVATYWLQLRRVSIEEERQDLAVIREGRDTYRQTTRDLRRRLSEVEDALEAERERRVDAEIEQVRRDLQATHLWARIDRLAALARDAGADVPDALVAPWPTRDDVDRMPNDRMPDADA